ncbi:neuronal acetylcholine receptor subunit beta-3-like [Symsagittifera roscoffensis]|uniref:neuronal acetylcholine receptor subunit beta-3-like n=1 Tax=Symsagittifera roscoffensis TaxID=84072 RepID=UPI00307CA9A7
MLLQQFIFAVAQIGFAYSKVDKSAAQLVSDELYSELADGYNKYYRPLRNQRKTLQVTYGFALNQLIEVDVKHEKIVVLIWQRSSWVDEFLSWNPEDYDGIEVLRYDPVEVWLPDVIIQNSVGEFEPIREVTVLPLMVFYNGTVVWNQPLVKQVTCRMNVLHFPYDTQLCHFIVGSWTHGMDEIDVQINSDTIDRSNYIDHNQWSWLRSSAKRCEHKFDNVGRFSYLDYYIILERKSQFYEMNLVIPTGLISGLAFVAFLLPSDSGEKVGFGITVFLSLCVNLLIISEFIPASSKSFPIIGKYYLLCIVIVALSLIITTLVLTLHHHATVKPVPEKIARIFFDWIGPWIGFPSRMLKRRNDRQLTQEQIDQEAEDEDNKLTQLIDEIMQQYSTGLDPSLNSSPASNTNSVVSPLGSDPEKAKQLLKGLKKMSKSKDGVLDATPFLSNGFDKVIAQLAKLEKLCEGIMYDKQRDRRRNAVIRDWQYLSRIVDRLSAILFVLLTTTLSFYFILTAKYGEPDLPTDKPYY